MPTENLTPPLWETLAVFETGTPRATTEVAAELEIGRRSTYERLERLVSHGLLETKKVGANARVWWQPADDVTSSALEVESLVFDVIDETEVGIFVLDSEFDVAWVNTTIEQYFGLDREEVIGRDKRSLIEEQITSVVDDDEAFSETVLQTYEDNTYVEQFECRVTAGDDREERWLEHRSRPIESGRYAGGRVELYYDVTDRKRSEQTRRAFESLVTAVEEYAIYMLDSDGCIQTWSPGARHLKGYESDEVVGEHVSMFYAEADREAGVPEQNLSEAAEEDVHEDEGWRVRSDGSRFWADTTINSIRSEGGDLTGYAVITRDMTDHQEYEERLEMQAEKLERQRDEIESELDEILGRVTDAFYALDDEWRFTHVNERAEELIDFEGGGLIGKHIWETFEWAADSKIREEYEQAMETQESTTFEIYYPEPLEAWYELHAYPSETGLSVYFRDVTERKEREYRLSRFERAVEAAGHAIYMTDADGTITYVNPAFEQMTGFSREEALGRTPKILDSGEHDDEYFERLWETIEGGEKWEEEIINRQKNGALYTAHQVISPVLDEDGDIDTFVAVQTDTTERNQYERELESQVRQQEVITELGQQALEDSSLDALMAEVSRLVAETLDNRYCKVLDLHVERDELLLRQGVGWKDGIVGEATVSSVEDDSQAAYTLANRHPVVVEDLTTETRFSGPALLTDHDVRSGISVVIGSFEEPWGILGTHDTESKSFSEQDVNFVKSVANILASAIERTQYEQKLLHQREELAALNSVNETVREITGAVIDQSTRDEIESVVCEHLANSDSYLFAWVGEADAASQSVDVRTEAGTDGYVDELSLSLESSDERSRGPTGKALRTGETHVSQDVRSDPEYEPWRELSSQYGFHASAAIPIVHENTVYGVLNVYTERAHAFDTTERTVISQVGEIIGHAIAANERKRALMNDELVELEFHIPDIFDAFDAGVSTDGQITLEAVVPVKADDYLVYGTATPDAVEALKALVDAAGAAAELTLRDDADDNRFEMYVSNPPVLSEVASHGGSLEEAVIESGDYRLTLHLSPTTDVGHIIDTVQENYPTAQMVARRQIERPAAPAGRLHEVLDAGLTERQLASLLAAYHAGFFEWPRDVQAESVAESLDIAPPTFSQHLRKAERKVFDALLSEGRVAD